MKTTIIDLLRHGEVRGGSCYRGSLDDSLTDLGWQQMQKQTARCDWDVLISSPLSRCHQFAEQLSQQLQRVLQTEADLREICFGDWEGKTAAQISADSPQLLKDFYTNPFVVTPPHGESYSAFKQRVEISWEKLLIDHQGRHLLIITHAGIIRLLFTLILGLSPKQGFNIDIPHACLSRFICFHEADSLFIQLISHKPL